MCRLKPVIINRRRGIFENCRYLPEIMFLYLRYAKYLEDDFTDRKGSFLASFTDLAKAETIEVSVISTNTVESMTTANSR